MDKVRVYYAGIPVKNTKPEKRNVLKFFHEGVPEGLSKEIETPTWEPAELAVMQGWVHKGSDLKSGHLRFRNHLIQKQKEIGKHILAVDSNLFLYKDPKNKNNYLRFSLNDVFPNTGIYFTDNVDPSRWDKIKKELDFDLKPWRQTGDHILICLQRNGGWSMDGLDVMQWLTKTITHICNFTLRDIVVRPHPGDNRVKDYLKINHPRVKISKNKDILDDFKGAWCTITYNSSPGVASVIEGIPTFVTDPTPQRSQAFDVATTDLSLIESPAIPKREDWIRKIAMSHFNFEDLKDGTAWNIIKDYL